MKNLVIVESPNKIKSIENYLGSDYKVMASVGHIFHLTTAGAERLGIDTATWTPLFKIEPKKTKVVSELKKAVKTAKQIYIATDPDREGEAIASHLVEALKVEKKYKRIRFNEITKSAVKESIDNANNNPEIATVDQNLVDAQIARRLLDRIIGFRLSKLMRTKVSGSPTKPSAGRVQSIALRLAVEREKEIETFVPYHYYKIYAKLSKDMLLTYINPNKKENKEWIDSDDVDSIFNSLKGPLVVKEIKETTKKDKKYVPLKQAMLYRLADTTEGISSIRVQIAAQKLYEGINGSGGLISYPRTDSSRFSPTFVNKSKEFIINKYGSEYFDAQIKSSSGKQDAHEAIRPTDLSLLPLEAKEKYNLDNDQFKVYSLIYFHTLKCLMTQPVKLHIQYKLENNEHEFRATTFKIKFSGYYKATKEPTPKMVPHFTKNDEIPVLEYIKEACQTNPPARYTEGMLIDKLDNIGVGRPSTFSTTIKNNKDRLYLLNEGKSLIPTTFGKKIISKLIEFFPKIMTYEYTANVEKELDKIAEGQRDYKELLSSFYNKFEKDIDIAYKTMELEKLKPESIGELCPESNHDLVHRVSRHGDKFIACSGFPVCTYTRSVSNNKRKWRNFNKKNKSK